MVQVRQMLKRYAPRMLHVAIQQVRNSLAAPPIEDLKLHDYRLRVDQSSRRRISLVIPTIAPSAAYGGVLTGLDIFLEIGLRTQAEMRVILDDYSSTVDRSVLDRRAQARGIDPGVIEVVPREAEVPTLLVRSCDVFVTFNWWVTLNVKTLLKEQQSLFKGSVLPYIYILQDYEPQFYPFSSTHMLARAALDSRTPHWLIVNSEQLFNYYSLQGHSADRIFVYEPALTGSLRPFMDASEKPREKRILVYGRPNIPRNCFPAICRGLNRWIASTPDHTQWALVSAGEAHKPIRLAEGRTIESLGKLSLESYAELLNTSAIGISLMASPHPSYPPLEMAHFGLLTITNTYTAKDLSVVHENIISVADITGDAIATAIEVACSRFMERRSARSGMPQFLRNDPFDCLDPVVKGLENDVWKSARV